MSDRRGKRVVRLMRVGLLGLVAAVGVRAGAQAASTMVLDQKLAFEVASVKPSPSGSTNEDWDSEGDRVTIKGYSLRKLIRSAYNLKSDAEIVGGPEWIDKRYFDIAAKLDEEEMAALRKDGGDREMQNGIQVMLQNLLRERFQLRVKRVEKEMPVFGLVVSGKPRLTADAEKTLSLSIRNGHMIATATSMKDLAESLSRMREVGARSVVDRTGLGGAYDFALDWTPDRGAGVSPEAAYPGLFTALHEQLGLELRAEKGMVQVIEVVAAEVPVFD